MLSSAKTGLVRVNLPRDRQKLFMFSNLFSRREDIVYLNSTRASHLECLSLPSCPKYPSRCLMMPSAVAPDSYPALGEFDTIGIIVSIHASTGSLMQTLYLTDDSSHFLGLIFWRGVKVCGK